MLISSVAAKKWMLRTEALRSLGNLRFPTVARGGISFLAKSKKGKLTIYIISVCGGGVKNGLGGEKDFQLFVCVEF